MSFLTTGRDPCESLISFGLRRAPYYYTDAAPTMSRIHRRGEVRGFVCEHVCKVVVCWGEGTMSREGGGDISPPTQEAAEFHSRSGLKRGEGLSHVKKT